MTRKKLSNTIFVLVLLLVLTTPKEGQGGRAVTSATKNISGKHPPARSGADLTTTDCELTLAFHSYADRTCPLPHTLSDPSMVAGAPNLNDNTRFYCKITVEPNVTPGTYNAVTYTSTWTAISRIKVIKVPNEVTSKVTVDFYEACNSCSGRQGRPHFTYTTTISRGTRNLIAQLEYLALANC